ncbi:MAG: HesA/MoeB/ThiF family protein [Desulfobacterales bacterium]|nr:ThiF family adenylyltransferase [Deltaproteobacteria bacterium]NNK96733.1 HesA/MoeB/ThiF family protein [Desulfobacterales bacterium]
MTKTPLLQKLKSASASKKRPDGSSYQSLLFNDEKRLVQETAQSHHQIQEMALENGIIPERYARNQRSLSTADQLKLLQAHVIIVGLGGLGGTVTEILARIGVGSLTLVDGDCFEDSNLNRQLLSSVADLDRSKAEVAAERVSMVNPAVDTLTVSQFLTPDNYLDLLNNTTLAVDCLDSIPDRFLLEKGCRVVGIPLVSAAIGGTSGQVLVILPGDYGLSQIYGEPGQVPQKGVEKFLGTLPYTAITMAALECAEVITLIVTKKARLQNRLLIADLSDHSYELVSFTDR